MADMSPKLEDVSILLDSFKKGMQSKLLLKKDSNIIGDYFFEILFQLFRRYKPEDLAPGTLYLTPSHFGSNKYTCILSETFDSLIDVVPTVDQLKESYAWHKREQTLESQVCRSLEDWKKLYLSNAFLRIEVYKHMLAQGLTPWQTIFHQEGLGLQFSLVDQYSKSLQSLRKREAFLKQKDAPLFMCVEAGNNLKRVKEIIYRLEHVTSP